MFDRVTIRAADRDASERFYETVLRVLGLEPRRAGELTEWPELALAPADAERPPTRGLHVAFHAPSRSLVDELWRTGTAAGYRDDGRPGPRPQYSPDYYGAFLLDPDGNSVEAVAHAEPRRCTIDHLWLRVADVDAATRFYERVAPYAGFSRGRRLADPDRTIFETDGRGSFSVVGGEPTRNVHLAFPAADDAAADAFRAAGLGADPDGNIVALVHARS